MDELKKNKNLVHTALVNLDETHKNILASQCAMQGIEVEKLENTMAIVLCGAHSLYNGLLKKNVDFLSK